MKKRYFLMLLVLFFAMNTLTAYADEGAALLESRVSGQSIILYTWNTGSTGAQARIAFEDITGVTVDGQDGTLPVTTWLLLDNSRSIAQTEQEMAKQLLKELVSSRSPNEAFTLCTFSDHLNLILQESQDPNELKQAIDNIQQNDQVTYLTDCLDELLALEAARTDVRYVRIVVISDGVDNNPGGITRDELEKKLEKTNFPIYSIGCTGNAQELKEMYAISRQTNAKHWALSEVQNSDIISAMGIDEMPVCITVPIPDALCDGTTKGVQVTFDDGTAIQTQVDMPFGTIAAPTPEPTPKPTPAPVPTPLPVEKAEETPTAADWMREHWLPIVIIAFVIAALAVAGYFFLQRKKRQEAPVPEDAASPVQNKESSPPPGSIFLGREEEGNDITIDYSMISKRHCAIAVSGESITVYDLGSLNGTQVDNIKIERGGYRKAQSGSILTLADLEFRMEISYATPDFSAAYDKTVFLSPEETVCMVSSKRILRITDLSCHDRCYEVLLSDVPV